MPRPREFDLPTAVDRGTHLLWSKGYEATSLDDLLLSMRRARIHFAVVVEPNRATAGVVTLEDLLEELVGEIVDESDVDQPSP